jgi:3-oxoadipate enol-lactonase
MVAQFYKLTPELTVYCHDDCYADPWGARPETVVLVHGALESSEAWRAWVPHLSRQYRVLRPDLRGHGQSSRPGHGYPWSVGGLGADLIALLDALGVQRAHLVGAKIGGATVLEASRVSPERVLTATAVSPLIHYGESRIKFGSADWPAESLEGWLAGTMRARLGSAAAEAQIRYWTDFSLRQTDPRQRIEILQAMGQTDLRGAFPHMRTPILLVGAEQSALTPAAQMRAWVDLLPAGEFLEIPGDGFHVSVSAPDLCAAGVLGFIRRHPDEASAQRSMPS